MNKKIIICVVFCVFIVSALTFTQTRPICFEDFIRIKRISDPQLSPQGDLIACVVTEMDLDQNSSSSDIWLIPLNGEEPRPLTTHPQADSSPRFSPDGRNIAFISTRDGIPQIWLAPLDNPSELVLLTNRSTGVSSFVWSPSGEQIAFACPVFPDCPDDECNARKKEELKNNPVQAKVFERLLFRHWNQWSDGTHSHVHVLSLPEGKETDMTPGSFDTPPLALGGTQDYVFSPQGDEICFVRNVDPLLKKGLGTNNDLFIASLHGGEISKITSNPANDHSPRYSPDGRYLVYCAMIRSGFEADKKRLILYDRQTQEKKNLTAQLDRSIDEILWAPDSSSLLITYEEQGRTVLSRLKIEDNSIEILLEGHFFRSLSLAHTGRNIIFLKETIKNPAEIYSFDIQTKRLSQLSHFNDELASSLEMNPPEDFWFVGAGGDRVHGFLLKPPFFSESEQYPLLMLLHGGPQGAWSDNFHYRWNAQMFAAGGYVVAMINFHGSTGYGQAFTDSISGDWGGKPFDDIMTGITYLISHNSFIDKDRIGAAGASYGGYLINWIEGHTDRFKCLISHAGVFDLRSMYGATEELWFPEWEFRGTPWSNPEVYETLSPSSYVNNFNIPCLVIHGQLDFRVPVTQGFQLFTSLQRMDVPSKLIYFPDEGHFVTKPRNAELWWEQTLGWLSHYLK